MNILKLLILFFKYTLLSLVYIYSTSLLAFEKSNDSTPWSYHKFSNDFTQNNYCYVKTNFLKNSSGIFIRSLLIPVDGVGINTRGDFVDINYQVSIGLMGNITKDIQALIDGQPYDFDNNMMDAISKMRTASELRVRFQYNDMLGKSIEEHTIKLNDFNDAYIEARKMCGDSTNLENDTITEEFSFNTCQDLYKSWTTTELIEQLCSIEGPISNILAASFSKNCDEELDAEMIEKLDTDVIEELRFSIQRINRDTKTNVEVFCNSQSNSYAREIELMGLQN